MGDWILDCRDGNSSEIFETVRVQDSGEKREMLKTAGGSWLFTGEMVEESEHLILDLSGLGGAG